MPDVKCRHGWDTGQGRGSGEIAGRTDSICACGDTFAARSPPRAGVGRAKRGRRGVTVGAGRRGGPPEQVPAGARCN